MLCSCGDEPDRGKWSEVIIGVEISERRAEEVGAEEETGRVHNDVRRE